jgi:hypothetical protein
MATALAAAPAFAQDGTTTPPAPTTPPAAVLKQQGLGIFLQGGWMQSNVTGSDLKNFNPQGFIAGVGFGGNKSGAFGVGVDLNYMWQTENGTFGDTIKTQSLDIPVYGRFNIGGHNTKNAFTFYIPAGWFFDVLLASDLGGQSVKDSFNGFQTGPMVGAGFEVYRIAVEARYQWALMDLFKSDADVAAGKPGTFIVMFKVRVH